MPPGGSTGTDLAHQPCPAGPTTRVRPFRVGPGTSRPASRSGSVIGSRAGAGAAADRGAVSMRATGAVTGEVEGHTLALPAKPDAKPELTATLGDGKTLDHLR